MVMVMIPNTLRAEGRASSPLAERYYLAPLRSGEAEGRGDRLLSGQLATQTGSCRVPDIGQRPL
eukprot:1449985-Pyramimonas_sp.AAC.1